MIRGPCNKEHLDAYTVEPLNNGHIGTRHFVLYREVVLSLEIKMYIIIFLVRPLFRVSLVVVLQWAGVHLGGGGGGARGHTPPVGEVPLVLHLCIPI